MNTIVNRVYSLTVISFCGDSITYFIILLGLVGHLFVFISLINLIYILVPKSFIYPILIVKRMNDYNCFYFRLFNNIFILFN